MDANDIKRIIKENNISYLRLQFTDMLGDIKAIEVPVSKLDDVLNNKIMLECGTLGRVPHFIFSEQTFPTSGRRRKFGFR